MNLTENEIKMMENFKDLMILVMSLCAPYVVTVFGRRSSQGVCE